MLPNEPHLAEVTESQASPRVGECLSLFFAVGERPDPCVVDPSVVGERAAPGHWQLLGVDEGRRRAYYARVAHGAQFDCAARVVGVRRGPRAGGDR